MKKRLNRERTNVGRTLYSERVRSILKVATSDEVIRELANQARFRGQGAQSDEVQWIEVAQRALTLLHERSRVTYVTESDLEVCPGILQEIKTEGYTPIMVTEREKDKLEEQADAGGPEVRTLSVFIRDYNASFDYKFVDVDELTPDERAVFLLTPHILSLVDPPVNSISEVRVAERLRLSMVDTLGVWDRKLSAIIVKRETLRSAAKFAGVLLHEAAHAFSGASDATRDFERVLSDYLGQVASIALGSPTAPRPVPGNLDRSGFRPLVASGN